MEISGTELTASMPEVVSKNDQQVSHCERPPDDHSVYENMNRSVRKKTNSNRHL